MMLRKRSLSICQQCPVFQAFDETVGCRAVEDRKALVNNKGEKILFWQQDGGLVRQDGSQLICCLNCKFKTEHTMISWSNDV